MRGLLLRLAGPLQSWGEHSTFSQRDTQSFPTRSGLLGMIAAAFGQPRRGTAEFLGTLTPLRITIRVDRRGVPLSDFHTVGGGLPPKQTVPISEGGHRPRGEATLVSRRLYLSDAAFTVAIEGPDARIDEIADALQHPVWPAYLGRRACPPADPLIIASGVTDAAGLLRTSVPLARQAPRFGKPISIDFVHEEAARPLTAHTPTTGTARTELWDVPLSFDRLGRRFASRRVWVVREQLPAVLCAGQGIYQLRALARFRDQLRG